MKKLRFLHIPKTAGSTFSRILRSQYRGRPYFVFGGNNPRDLAKYSALSKGEQEAIVLFLGHAPIVSGIKEADEAPTITFLREPVSRVKSFCQYVSEGKSNTYLRENYPPETFDLDEFLSSGYSELSNLQSRMLVNYEKKGDELLTASLTPEQLKAKALDNLFRKIACFGLQKYFDESLMLFTSHFNWRSPYYEYVNRKNEKKLLNFEEHHIRIIRELNAVDIEMYAAAEREFIRRFESDEKYRKMCNRFKQVQKVASPVLKIYGNTGRYIKREYRKVLEK